MDFISATGNYVDLKLMQVAANTIIQQVGWGSKDQIGLTYRPGSENPWFDAAGSLYDRESKRMLAQEKDFSQYNPIPTFLKEALSELERNQKIKFGRIRLMKLTPRRGLSVHYDAETRYHYVLDTNPKAFICVQNNNSSGLECRAQCYHLPSDGQWYHVDTRQTHWVYNGGDRDRIHLVLSTL